MCQVCNNPQCQGNLACPQIQALNQQALVNRNNQAQSSYNNNQANAAQAQQINSTMAQIQNNLPPWNTLGSQSNPHQWILDLIEEKQDCEVLIALLDKEKEVERRHQEYLIELEEKKQKLKAEQRLALFVWCKKYRPTITPELLDRLLANKAFL